MQTMKKALTVLFTALVMVFASFAVASCELLPNGNPEHVHSFGEWTVTTPPTCTEDGEETRVCSADSTHTETRPVNATGHDYKNGKCESCGELDPDYEEEDPDTSIIDENATKGLEYTLNSNGNSYSVTGIGTATATDIVISSTYNGKPVTAIGENAFEYCESITNITIPDSATSINDYAFWGCESLTSITFGEHSQLTSIGENAFGDCGSLKNITFGENSQLTSIGEFAFSGCESLTSITIPDSVTFMGENAFSSCTGLTSIMIPASLTSINNFAFEYCYNLTSITITHGVTSIGIQSFLSCYSLTSITIPDSITSIGYGAFEGCEGLTSITFQGTTEEWNAIEKAEYWDSFTDDYTITCTNGTLDKNGNVIEEA